MTDNCTSRNNVDILNQILNCNQFPREEIICAMEPRLRLKRSPTGVGLEPGTARSPTYGENLIGPK